jgi:hypothetical protein
VSAGVDTDLARVAGELYGALMDARPFIARLAGVGHVAGTLENPVRAMTVLDRIDAALAESLDYLGEGE